MNSGILVRPPPPSGGGPGKHLESAIRRFGSRVEVEREKSGFCDSQFFFPLLRVLVFPSKSTDVLQTPPPKKPRENQAKTNFFVCQNQTQLWIKGLVSPTCFNSFHLRMAKSSGMKRVKLFSLLLLLLLLLLLTMHSQSIQYIPPYSIPFPFSPKIQQAEGQETG